MGFTTPWQKVKMSDEAAVTFPKGYTIWCSRLDGEHVFLILLDDKTPDPGDGGYRSLPEPAFYAPDKRPPYQISRPVGPVHGSQSDAGAKAFS